MTRYSFGWKKAKKIYNKTGGRCFYCGIELPKNTDFKDDGGLIVSSRRNWDIEHVIPLSRGGTNDIDNLVPACQYCNGTKMVKTCQEFTPDREKSEFYSRIFHE